MSETVSDIEKPKKAKEKKDTRAAVSEGSKIPV
jgi:hypothetical protein